MLPLSRFGTNERLADLTQREALRFLGQGGFGALDGFEHRFVAEAEGLMVNGDEVASAGLVGHVYGLLGRAMVPDPGIVRANGHDREIVRTVSTMLSE